MQKKNGGLVTALLCVFLILSGCGRQDAVYTAGMNPLTFSQQGETESPGASDVEEPGKETETERAAAAVSAQSGSAESIGADGSESPQAGYIYVCGAVREPGVYPVREDMRVCDAILLAGGFDGTADEEWLNQAEKVADGQRLYVYTLEETARLKEQGITAEANAEASLPGAGGAAASSPEAASGSGSELLNLNTASKEELMTLPGIGESKADAILQYRSEQGPFQSIEEIQNISGIKSGVFSKIRDRITV